MNAEAVRSRIVATLSPDANVRRAAELELKAVCAPCLDLDSWMPGLSPTRPWHCAYSCFEQAEGHPGFTDVLLDVLTAEPEDSVRLSSVPSNPSRPLRRRTPQSFIRPADFPSSCHLP